MHKFVGVVLAAGVGSRMFSQLPKVLHKIFDKTLLEYCVTSLINAGASHIIIITGFKEELVKAEILKWNLSCKITTVSQHKQLGTGHAVKMTVPFLDESNIIVTCGDTPLILSNTIRQLLETHINTNMHCTLASTILKDSTGYGRIVRQSATDTSNAYSLLKIVEEKDTNEAERLIKEINTGVYCFNKNALTFALEKINNNNALNEYYLTDTVEILLNNEYKANAIVFKNEKEFLGVNTRLQLSEATKILQNSINNYHMQNGVTIMDPNTTYISENVKIGMDTVIYPSVMILGSCEIGENNIIGPNTSIYSANIGNNTKIENSTIREATIGDFTTVGPYAHIRPSTIVGQYSRIGNFVEIKNTKLGNKTKLSHLSYVGDANIGNDVNIGCGVITVNYDGKKKHKTIIEDGVFIGCNSNIIAPNLIQSNSYIAAGTTITEEVPENSLAIGRVKQVNKENYLNT